MKFKSPSLILYTIATILAIVGVTFNMETLELIAKPMIVPSIYFFYVNQTKGEVNLLFSIAIFTSFVADMLVLIDLSNSTLPISILNICMYSIFIYFIVDDLGFKSIKDQKVFSLIGFFLFFLFVLYVILDLMKGLDNLTFNVFTVYGIILSSLSALICYNHFNKPSLKSYYALLICICFVVSDVFFAIYNFYLKIDTFISLNVTGQFVSYYYMVRYITINNVLPENDD